MNDQQPLLRQDVHFGVECSENGNETRRDDSGKRKTISFQGSHTDRNQDTTEQENIGVESVRSPREKIRRRTRRQTVGSSIIQTSLNIAKVCMGTGTLALPFAAEKGGLLLNVLGLVVIASWNYYSVDCLLRCFELLPEIDFTASSTTTSASIGDSISVRERRNYQSVEMVHCEEEAGQNPENEGTFEERYNKAFSKVPFPPEGTTTYGLIAWYATGPKGLLALDILMVSLFMGLLIAYEVAMMGFIDDMPFSAGSGRIDLLLPSLIVSLLSCVPDVSVLSNFSASGLMALAASFFVISWQGLLENGLSGFIHVSDLNLWPESWTGASNWFGVAAFGFGVAPVIFNIKESMTNPHFIGISTKIGLSVACVGYIIISDGIRILFSPTHNFQGDVLQVMPDTWISLLVRLLMTFVVAVTAPLVVVPCGELIEGKLGMEESPYIQRISIRILICVLCTAVSEFVPGFVYVVSIIGCFCVSILGFVMPPLFCVQLTSKRKLVEKSFQAADSDGIIAPTPTFFQIVADMDQLFDVLMVLIGIVASVITSTLTVLGVVAHFQS